MARGPQVALSSGWREELPGELRCAARPQGLQAEGSPPRLGTSRTWRGEPGACPARPVEAYCSGKGENSAGGWGAVWGVSPAMSVGMGSCSPAASPRLGFSCPAGPQGWARCAEVPSPSGAAAPPVQTSVQPQAVSGQWGLGPPRGSPWHGGPCALSCPPSWQSPRC